jgi:spermidine synthase
MTTGIMFSENISRVIEGGLYRDDVILIEQTQYQKIVVTKHKDDLRLYIDGNCQFSSADEYRYHEGLVHIPMLYANKHDNVLILGGGDGLAVRELLKYPDVKQITMIDLDKGMTDLCSTDSQISQINEGSLKSDKLTILNMDAYEYLERSEDIFDVIIVDLPDPNNEALNKLYSNIFYRLCNKHLTADGIMNVQSTSPYYAPKAFWCINRTIESEGMNVMPYHLQVPAFGDWGFNMASRSELEKKHELITDTRYLTADNMDALFSFGKDEVDSNTDINRLTKPVLIQYYNDAVRDWE